MRGAGRPAVSLLCCQHARMRLDEEKLEALRGWGERLGESTSEEHAAIGRAILMLVEEIDRLHIDLWHRRMQPSEGGPVEPVEPVEAPELPEERDTRVASSLHGRLQRVLRRGEAADSPAPSRPAPEGDASVQAWIDTLRRQK